LRSYCCLKVPILNPNPADERLREVGDVAAKKAAELAARLGIMASSQPLSER